MGEIWNQRNRSDVSIGRQAAYAFEQPRIQAELKIGGDGWIYALRIGQAQQQLGAFEILRRSGKLNDVVVES